MLFAEGDRSDPQPHPTDGGTGLVGWMNCNDDNDTEKQVTHEGTAGRRGRPRRETKPRRDGFPAAERFPHPRGPTRWHNPRMEPSCILPASSVSTRRSPMEVCSQSQRMRKSLPPLSEFRRNRWWDEQTLIWTDRAPLGDVSRSMCSPPRRPPTTRLKEPS